MGVVRGGYGNHCHYKGLGDVYRREEVSPAFHVRECHYVRSCGVNLWQDSAKVSHRGRTCSMRMQADTLLYYDRGRCMRGWGRILRFSWFSMWYGVACGARPYRSTLRWLDPRLHAPLSRYSFVGKRQHNILCTYVGLTIL